MRRLSLALLLVFVFTIPWQTAIGGRSKYILALALGSTLLTFFMEKQLVRPPALVLAVAAFIFWQLVSYYWSADPGTTLSTVYSMIPMLVLVFLVVELGAGEQARYALLQAFVLGCVVLCFMILGAYTSGQSTGSDRFAPEGFSLNESADMLAAGIAMAIMAISKRRRGVFFYVDVALLPLGLVSVVVTGSRSGFVLACAAMLGVVILLWKVKAVYRAILVLVLLGGFTAVLAGMSGDQALQASIDRVTFSTDKGTIATLTGRTDIWSAGIRLFKENPLVGLGAGTFPSGALRELGIPWSAHSLFVETAAEGGLVGLGLLLAMWASAIAPALARPSGTPFHVIVLIVLLGTSLVANFTTQYSLWFGVAVVAAGTVSVRGAIQAETSRHRFHPTPPLED